MKTSNKIITLIFGLLILIPALVVATIIFKYRNGNFTRLDMKSGIITKTFPGIKSINLKDLRFVYIVPSDSLYAEIDAAENTIPLKIDMQGDRLLINPDTILTSGDGQRLKNNEQLFHLRQNSIRLYLPAGFGTTIENCGVTLTVDSKLARPEAISLQLINSTLNDNIWQGAGGRFRKITLASDHSVIGFSANLNAEEMELLLENNSRLDLGNASIGHLILNVDSSSSLQLNGKQLNSIIQKK